MGISLQYKAVCDRCGERENVGAEIHHDTISTTAMPDGWSKATRYVAQNKEKIYLCVKCTYERSELDKQHASQIQSFYNKTLTSVSLEYMKVWTDGLRRPVEVDPAERKVGYKKDLVKLTPDEELDNMVQIV